MIIHNSIVYLLLEYHEKTNIANADGSTALNKAFSEKSKNFRDDTITCLFHELNF